MDRAHTPGPWLFSFESVDPEWAVVITTGGSIVANVNADHRQEANARLIAAAPDMFEALKTFVVEYVDFVESGDAGFWDPEKEAKVIAARAALAKAEGLGQRADATSKSPLPSSPQESGR